MEYIRYGSVGLQQKKGCRCSPQLFGHHLKPLKKSKMIAEMIKPINNKGPMPELYTKYTVIWRKAITTR